MVEYYSYENAKELEKAGYVDEAWAVRDYLDDMRASQYDWEEGYDE